MVARPQWMSVEYLHLLARSCFFWQCARGFKFHPVSHHFRETGKCRTFKRTYRRLPVYLRNREKQRRGGLHNSGFERISGAVSPHNSRFVCAFPPNAFHNRPMAKLKSPKKAFWNWLAIVRLVVQIAIVSVAASHSHSFYFEDVAITIEIAF